MSNLDDVARMLAERASQGQTAKPQRAKEDEPAPAEQDLPPASPGTDAVFKSRRAPRAPEPLATVEEEEDEPTLTDTTSGEEDQPDDIDEGEEKEEEEQPQGSEEPSDPPHVELDDDYVIEIPVDGENREVTLRELVDKFSLSGATEKRLQEVTETRREASQAREQALQEAEKVRQSVLSIVQHIDNALHQAQVPPPPEALKQSNPREYLRHMEAYQQDQERIQQSRSMMVNLFKEQGQLFDQVRQEHATVQKKALEDTLPVYRDPQTREAAQKDMEMAGKHVGFTDDEINSYADARVYQLAYLAAQYLKQMNKVDGKIRAKPTASGKPTPMRSGGTKAAQRRTSQQKKLVAVKKQAQKTGKPDDVAAYLMARRKGAQ